MADKIIGRWQMQTRNNQSKISPARGESVPSSVDSLWHFISGIEGYMYIVHTYVYGGCV